MRPLILGISLLFIAACDKSTSSSGSGKSANPSAARHIPGGSAQTWQGVSFDIPAGWRAQMQQDTLLLLPIDANASGPLEELYALPLDPKLKTLDGSQVDAAVEQAVAQLQPG